MHLVVLVKNGKLRGTVSANVIINDLNCTRSRYSVIPLRRYILKSNPDVILSVLHSTNIYTALSIMGINNKPRIVFREASPFPFSSIDERKVIRFFFFKLITRFCYSYANIVISNSNITRKTLILNSIINDSKIIVIGNPVLPDNYEHKLNKNINIKWFDDDSLKVILNVARLDKAKDHHTLIHAFKSAFNVNNKLRLLIIGDGPLRDSLIKLINEFALNEYVILLNFVSNPYPYYKNSDLFVLTSKWEGFGNVLVEAMSSGIKIIATNSYGGVSEILENGKYGELVKVGDVKTLCRYILTSDSRTINQVDVIERAKCYTISNISKIYLKHMFK